MPRGGGQAPAAAAADPAPLLLLNVERPLRRTPQIAHLRSERDILRGLDHAAMVRLHGCCQDAQCVYFVLEFVPGEWAGGGCRAAGAVRWKWRGRAGEAAARPSGQRAAAADLRSSPSTACPPPPPPLPQAASSSGT